MRQACRAVARRWRPALEKPRESLLSRDYLVFAVNELDRPHSLKS